MIYMESIMPGIILSLLVTFVALSFAFYTDNSAARTRRDWQNSSSQAIKRSGEKATPLQKSDIGRDRA